MIKKHLLPLMLLLLNTYFAQAQIVQEVCPGVFKITLGKPDTFTPERFREELPQVSALRQLPAGKLPFNLTDIKINFNPRGTIIELPLSGDEQLYGFGLQMGSFRQNRLRKVPVVNDYPSNDLGYSHAPVPYYVSNKGYAVLVNTAKYTTFYCGGNQPKQGGPASKNNSSDTTKLTVQDLYNSTATSAGNMLVDIPGVNGIEIFVFAGPDMLTAVQRYNLFSGGGAMPPLWALGIKYRVKADFKDTDVYKTTDYFRKKQLPISVIGLEPRWQTAAYPCSFAWNPDFFPYPAKFIAQLKSQGYQVNLWEHAFVSSSSPIYQALLPQSGNYLAFNGLVPDFASAKGRDIFAQYHQDKLVDIGISGFKLDECDNSDLRFGSARWSFPELSQFPSGIDGERMHQVFGLLYQKTIYNIYKKLNQRTLLDVRSSGALAAPYPAALYSDTYDHAQYVEQISNTGFSGLLWSPEVRESSSFKELARRSQTAILSAQTLYNSWYLQNPPWLQFDRDKNNKGILLPDAEQNEATIKKLLNFRMQLIPYLYEAFHKYQQDGYPVFRALVMDYPSDEHVFEVANEYMIGKSLLAAPIVGGADTRDVYLPSGNWYNFNTNEKYTGGKSYRVNFKLDDIPLFVKEGTILPLAAPIQFTDNKTVFHLTCSVYGKKVDNAYLFEDDGISFNYLNAKCNNIELTIDGAKVKMKRKGTYVQKRYVIDRTTIIP
ncbi:TIM-barrel domain-containing protein [Mucilaginibacter sp. CSA2-8R]|uniref:glycoside hydrolase family 31 protein n=1 Tax=Mucilaginibacter sp. CSA2-8R TaxID=3141542 RepID=UPI00315DD112